MPRTYSIPGLSTGFVKYNAAHERVKRLWGPARQYPCVQCGKPADHWAYDNTDPTELMGRARYSLFPEFYMPMCASHHQLMDRATYGRVMGSCTVDGCDGPHKAWGMCNYHYRRELYGYKRVLKKDR